MKKSNFLLLFLLCIYTGIFAQKQNVYFIKDDGQYVETRDSADFIRIVQEPDKGSALYIVKEFYLDGKVRSLGLSLKIEPLLYEGIYRAVYKNGNKKQVANYVKGKLSGPVYNYYPNGKLYTRYLYENAVPGSIFTSYKITDVNDSTGNVLVKEGNGECVFYDNDFKYIAGRGKIKNGEYDGVWTGEDQSQHITYKETYEQGKMIAGESTDQQNVTVTYTKSAVQPEYKGGVNNFYRYLGQSIRYPPNCQRMGIQGVVMVTFAVDKDGSLHDIRVSNYANEELAAEAVRVIRQSPSWMPGMMRGRKVRVRYNVPVSFALSQ
ncbi:TonB family C-terminal domain-containing protein [Pedobacter westerhofensis]|uniref:TonB family C-terminal domain-containing protein n=1 Tax=Pedobacter westerhofensis TaxID=425512 RepID=A0A521F8B9_9SPHI|nr:energy transducer TonB [Pedobacter westerhofensis]SMO91730.1 TonB family C-terminal domain-containing protein [Pedobacter westerhofensis]